MHQLGFRWKGLEERKMSMSRLTIGGDVKLEAIVVTKSVTVVILKSSILELKASLD